jgi:hypothetical protein
MTLSRNCSQTAGSRKKARHADQQLLEEQIQFLRVFLQVTDIIGNLANLVDAHAALDPAVESVFLVNEKSWPVWARSRMMAFSRALSVLSSSACSEV